MIPNADELKLDCGEALTEEKVTAAVKVSLGLSGPEAPADQIRAREIVELNGKPYTQLPTS